MIILEGADNSGKSELAKRLNSIFGLRIRHAGGPGYSPRRLLEDERYLQTPWILDRLNCISGPVYENALNVSVQNYDFNQCKRYIQFRAFHGMAFIIHCTGKGQETSRPEEDQDYVAKVHKNDDLVRFEYDLFFTSMYNQGLVHRYDFKETDAFSTVVLKIIKFLENYDEYLNKPMDHSIHDLSPYSG